MKHLRSFWKKSPLILLLVATALCFELVGLGLQSRLPERRRADGLKTPFLTGSFLYLSGERAAPEPAETGAGGNRSYLYPPQQSCPGKTQLSAGTGAGGQGGG